jgi:cell division protein ZapA
MGQVAVTINGRTYTLQCTDGEEARLAELAGYVRTRADVLAAEFRSEGRPIGDDRLMLLTALLLADELWEAREQAAAAAASAYNGAHAHPGLSPVPSEAAPQRANGRVAR